MACELTGAEGSHHLHFKYHLDKLTAIMSEQQHIVFCKDKFRKMPVVCI